MKYFYIFLLLLIGCNSHFVNRTTLGISKDTKVEKSTLDSALTIIFDNKVTKELEDSVRILIWDAYSNPRGFDTIHSNYIKSKKEYADSKYVYYHIWEGCRNNSEYFKYVLDDILSNHKLMGYSSGISQIDSSLFVMLQTKGSELNISDSTKSYYNTEGYINEVNLYLKNKNQVSVSSYDGLFFVINQFKKEEFVRIMKECGIELK